MDVHVFPILNPTSHLPPCTIPLGHPSVPAPSILYHTSNLDWRFVSYMILYMFQYHSPKLSHPLPPTESKRLFYTFVSLLLSHIQGYRYHLSKFHIYALVYCIGLEKEMATHSSVLAWRIPGTGELGGLPSMGSHRVGHDWSDLAAAYCIGVFLSGLLHSV